MKSIGMCISKLFKHVNVIRITSCRNACQLYDLRFTLVSLCICKFTDSRALVELFFFQNGFFFFYQ